MNTQENGQKRRFSFPTLGCEGCAERKAIMGAGDWKMDLLIFGVIVALAFVMFKIKVA